MYCGCSLNIILAGTFVFFAATVTIVVVVVCHHRSLCFLLYLQSNLLVLVCPLLYTQEIDMRRQWGSLRLCPHVHLEESLSWVQKQAC
jgi:hypothetical protein